MPPAPWFVTSAASKESVLLDEKAATVGGGTGEWETDDAGADADAADAGAAVGDAVDAGARRSRLKPANVASCGTIFPTSSSSGRDESERR